MDFLRVASFWRYAGFGTAAPAHSVVRVPETKDSSLEQIERELDLLQLARLLWGGVLLLAPRRSLEAGGARSRGVVYATRGLGARYLVEALILTRDRGRRPPRWPVIIELAHGASMVVLAIRRPRVRRDAILSAAAAGLLGGWAELERRRA